MNGTCKIFFAFVLILPVWAKAQLAGMDSGESTLDLEAKESIENINAMLGVLMQGVEKDKPSELQKKLEILKTIKKEFDAETLLRLELSDEIGKIRHGIYFIQLSGSKGTPIQPQRLEVLKRIEKTFSSFVDVNQVKLLREKSEIGLV